jgi:hypothetical protein
MGSVAGDFALEQFDFAGAHGGLAHAFQVNIRSGPFGLPQQALQRRVAPQPA